MLNPAWIFALTFSAAVESPDTPIVFVHGIKGATLADANGDTAWLDGPSAVGLRTPDLRLPLTWFDGHQARDGLHAVAPLETVRVIPWLLEETVYGPFLTAMRRHGASFHPFAYDWRRDNHESLAQLTRFVERVRAAHGQRPVRIIAHSMGGLISLALLNAHPEYFHDVVFAGVPFGGGIGFLVDLHRGVATGLNRAILAPEVLFTFPSIYGFFPEDGGGLLTVAGAPVAMDFFDPGAWRRAGLSVFAPGRPPVANLPLDVAEGFLHEALPQARAFRALLVARPVAYPPILVVASHATPTLMRLVKDGPQSVYGWDFEAAPPVPGDGRVAYPNAMPPAGIPHRLVHSEFEHSALLNDPSVIGALDAL